MIATSTRYTLLCNKYDNDVEKHTPAHGISEISPSPFHYLFSSLTPTKVTGMLSKVEGFFRSLSGNVTSSQIVHLQSNKANP
jgi:hypothetical protein